MQKSALIYTAFAMVSLSVFPRPSPALDPASIECLSCHDNSTAGDVTIEVCPIPECDHPIAVDYVLISSANPGLTPASSLDPAIVLVDGAIGCTTCHVPYSQVNHLDLSALRSDYPIIPDPMLVMDNRASELCRACHRK